ncbi:adenylate/guanylate cyclase domain-containing protein [Ruegeria arenilitoris]|uniref:adenylate/guanylate cyclase domain-containing protein n=1 Tax=Ruegeria arenilitoris TaxID=1173585 RepID=UPI00147986B1
MKRRLTVILAIDVVGFSRLMGVDEAGTLAALKTHRSELIDPKAVQYGGRTIKLMGDGALMEFASVADAVRFAVEVQCAMFERNSVVPASDRIEFRIGINVGDVIDEDGDIYGDGVNLASRIEGLAQAGGVCVHRAVFNQVRGKLDLDFEDLGAVDVKNIEQPVSVFSVELNEKAKRLASPVKIAIPNRNPFAVRAVGVACVALIFVVGLVVWRFDATDFQPVKTLEMARPLPDKPSIAVLPFSDLSQGADKGFLSDAISEEIIGKLSRFPEFFVIARNSSFFYRDKSADIRDIASELGVRYVLEGSQQKSGGKLRVNATLIDATAGNAIWTDTYDRDMVDIFVLQDEITRTIVATLEQNIDLAEYDRLLRQPTQSPGAYELVYRSRAERFKFTPAGNQEAKRLAEEAIKLDPGYSVAYFSLAWVHINCDRWGWCAGRPREQALDLAFVAARKAVELDPDSSLAHWVLAHAFMQANDLEQSEREYERAITLNPNSAGVLAGSVETLVYLGRANEAVERLQTAIRLNPHHPDWYLWSLAWARYFTGEYEAGLEAINRMTNIPNLARRTQAALYVRLGRFEEARASIIKLLENQPDYTIEDQRHSLIGKFKDQSIPDGFIEDLRSAGLPDRHAD